MAKPCPLCLGGKCDYPDLLGQFPGIFQERCGSDGECLLRKVPVIGTDDGTGEELNLVRAKEFSVRFKHWGMSIPLVKFQQSIWNYTRGVPI